VHEGEEGHARPGWDNIKTWTGLSMEESIRMTEDRDKWRKYIHGVANPALTLLFPFFPFVISSKFSTIPSPDP